MRLNEVTQEIERLQEEDSVLKERQKVIAVQSLKLGTALKASMAHLSEPGVGRIEFQSGDSQYVIDNSGELRRINEIERIDNQTEVEIPD